MTNEENVNLQPDEIVVEDVQEKVGLSMAEALQVAHTALEHKEPEEKSEVEVKEKVVEEAPKKEEPAPYTPPAEWNAEEKADFQSSTRKQQEAALRLHKARNSRLEEIQRATSEYKSSKRLAESLDPILKARGFKEPLEVVIPKIADMWRDIEGAKSEAETKYQLAQIMLAKGHQPPEDWLNPPSHDPRDDHFRAIQERQDRIENRLAQEEQAKVEQVIVQNWNVFEQTKNASGTLRYPDLVTPSGPQLAADIGSLVNDKTQLSKEFIARTLRRIPDLTPQKLIEEAYRVSGGKVDDSLAPAKSQGANNHLQKAKRAAASRPGSSIGTSINGSSSKKLSHGDALLRAWEDLNSDN